MNSIGKQVSGKRYVHVSVLPLLSPDDHDRVRNAIKHSGLTPDKEFNVVRVSNDGEEVALLAYPQFLDDPFPALAASWRFHVASNSVRFRDYSQSLNPPILHRKELLVSPDHPDYERFAALTKVAESLGLFDDPIRIGFRSSWLELIRSKGYQLRNHELLPIGNVAPTDFVAASNDGLIAIQRHRTALSRTALSAPVQSLIRYGLLHKEVTLFDYGCGKGTDIEGLTTLGILTSGWDPFYRSAAELAEADVVNLGFVINVIEEFDERVSALQSAFRIARQVLAVSAMLTSSAPPVALSYRDGVLSSRDTFQKYYRQEELQQFIESVLDEEAVPVAPGIFYVFKDGGAEQRFLLARAGGSDRARRVASLEWRRPREAPERRLRQPKPSVEDPVEAALADQLWATYIELGRPPEEDELSYATELITKFGSLARARRVALRRHDESSLVQAANARCDDIAVMFALHMFSKRRPFRSLGIHLQRDIKALFGSLLRAEARARELLFSVREVEHLQDACAEAASKGLGWLENGHSLQLHSSLVARLPAILQVYLGCATAFFGDLTNVDLVKIHIQSGKVTLMRFDDFVGNPLPAMTERIKVRLRDQEMDLFTYGEAFPPPLLYFKSRFVNEEFPNYPEQRAFEEQLEELRIFDLSGYGPPAGTFWETLRRARWTIEGYKLERSKDIPALDVACGERFTFRDLIECGDTWERTRIKNCPLTADSYNALADLARLVLDPVVEYFGGITLTYGFCSSALKRLIGSGIAPELDQHCAHEKTRTGRLICSRNGAAVDLKVEDEDMADVVNWISINTPFDRIYFYGSNRPIHVSYGPNHSRQTVDMKTDSQNRRVPQVRRPKR